MGEFQEGAIYLFNDEGFRRYKGGPVPSLDSWESVSEEQARRDGFMRWDPAAGDWAPSGQSAARQRGRQSAEESGRISNTLRLLAQGVTQSGGDELAGVRFAPPSDRVDYGDRIIAPLSGYDPEAAAESRGRVDRLREMEPWRSLGTEIAGGLMVPVSGAATAARAMASRGMPRLAAGLLAGAGAGAVGGAAVGIGEGEGSLSERAPGTVVPAMLGASFGLGGALAGSGINRVVQRFRGEGGAGAAQADLRRPLRDARIPEDEIVARTRALGDEAVVADLAPNLSEEARVALNRAPAVKALPDGPFRRLGRRAGERGERLAEALRRASGLGSTFSESLEAAEAAVERVSREWFQPLEELHPRVTGDAVREVLEDPRITPIVERVAPDAAPRVSRSGIQVPPERPPTFREIQDIRGMLADDIERAVSPSGRVLPNERQLARQALRRLDDALAEDVPGYGQARVEWYRAQQRVGAHEMGRKAARGRKAPDQIQSELDALPTEEAKEAYRVGMLDQIEMDLLERGGQEAASGGATANRLMQIPDNEMAPMRRRLRLLLGEEGLEDFLQRADAEWRFSQTWSAVKGGSQTQGLQSLDRGSRVFQGMAPNKQFIIRRLLNLLPSGLSADEVRNASEVLARALLGQGEEAAELIAAEMGMASALARAGTGAAAGTAAGTAASGRNDRPLDGGLF